MKVDKFLEGNHVKRINKGKGGADVYEINETHILKHAVRQNLNSEAFDSYLKEARFYKFMSDKGCKYIPKILELIIEDDELIIVMKKYDDLQKEFLNEEVIQKLAGRLAEIHLESVPDFIKCRKTAEIELSDEKKIEYTYGWITVLNEHPGYFDNTLVEKISTKINQIIKWHNTEKNTLIHGDFHLDNLLIDSHDNILICDWQSVKLGEPSSDLSFFMSRLNADGVDIDQDFFLQSYVNSFQKLSGNKLSKESILRHISAANVITSFIYWHQFLHNNSVDRVREIFNKMIEDYYLLFPEDR